ncbi:NAD(P)/FAD-dependent oxidoreductase [Actinophytocola sp.]|uniref:NAD(P)/FAD-dependent oxidoreductase n=1 Tax=Actinophytocola sp. TaxID=1872138 RepID=UPI003D6B91A0
MSRPDVVVVGGGPGGLTAAALLAESSVSVAVVDQLGGGGQLLNLGRFVDDFGVLGPGTGPELGAALIDRAGAAGAEVGYGQATSLELRDGEVVVGTDFGPRTADRVVIATGTRPRPLGIDGGARLEGRGVCYCAACDGPMYAGRPVAVLGGGEAVAYEAIELAEFASGVIVIADGAARIPPRLGAKLAADERIEVLTGWSAESLHGATAVESLTVAGDGQTRELAIAGLFVCNGVLPNTEWCADVLPLDATGRIDVDLSLRAGDTVYAIGDVRSGAGTSVVAALADAAAVTRRLVAELATT